VGRNIGLREGARPDAVAAALRELHRSLAAKSAEAILSGEI
jgi:hypothetical protein